MEKVFTRIKSVNGADWVIVFNEALIGLLAFALFAHLIHLFPENVLNSLLMYVSIIGIIPVIYSAIRALIKREITIDLLASIALIFTFVEHDWLSATFVNLMLTSARLFDGFTQRRTQDIISHLYKLRPSTVKVQEGETIKIIALEAINIGDLVVVESGDRIPIDGMVIKGEASIDQSTLTGESQPIPKKVGDKVFSSTLNTYGSLIVKAEKVGKDTQLYKIISLVNEASRAKTKTETLANKFSAWYIVLTILAAVVIYLVTKNMGIVLGVLLVTCADDIAVAIPLGFTVAIAKAARHGIIVKGAAVMERLKDTKIFLTDKTGTITKGASKVSEVKIYEGITDNEFNKILSICATDSKHPTSLAIVRYVKEKGVELIPPDEVKEFPGDGIVAVKHGKEYIEGKLSFVIKRGATVSDDIKNEINAIEEKGMSVSVLSENNKLIGYIAYEDEIKKYAKESIAETKSMGVEKWIMLTGDNNHVAERVANAVGIDEYRSNLTPEGKLDAIKFYKKKHGAIAMMGDGVNDAAALAMADVSFAMGTVGSDATIEAADVALMHDDLRRVPEAMYLSRQSIRIVKQNFAIWALTNGIGLYLVFGGFIGPVGASLFNFLTDFLPIMNVFKIHFLKINRHTYDLPVK